MDEVEAAGALRSLKYKLNKMCKQADEVEKALASAPNPLAPELEYAGRLRAALHEANAKVPEPPALKPS